MSKGGSEMGAVPAVKGLKGRTRKQCRYHGRGGGLHYVHETGRDILRHKKGGLDIFTGIHTRRGSNS